MFCYEGDVGCKGEADFYSDILSTFFCFSLFAYSSDAEEEGVGGLWLGCCDFLSDFWELDDSDCWERACLGVVCFCELVLDVYDVFFIYFGECDVLRGVCEGEYCNGVGMVYGCGNGFLECEVE